MFAVIKSGGKQYRVSPQDIVTVEKLAGDAGDTVEFTDVLIVGDADNSTIGTPRVEGAMVTGEVVSQGRGPKVISFKKRRRQNSKRTRGHRQWLTTVRISEILTDGAKPSAKKTAKKSQDTKPAETAKSKEAEGDAKPESVKAAPATPDKPVAAEASAPLFSAPEGKGDDLTKIKGIGPVAKKQLNEQGIKTFAQLAELTEDDIARIDEAMPFSSDQIADWRDQAKSMAK